MSVFRQFLKRIAAKGVRRAETVETAFLGRRRVFEAYDIGDDTFILERGVAARLKERPSVLMAEKRQLRRRSKGRVMTVTTGNHAVAALPLTDGRFWKIANLPPPERSATLARAIVCANIVGETLELSQREVPTEALVACDEWLLGTVGLARSDVAMVERNEATLEHYRRRGEEWRVKPLAWTASEMRAALAASRKRIGTKLAYYHSARGVHFLSYAEFSRFAASAESDPESFVRGLGELVGVYEGSDCSFVRMPKHRGHHEIEFFGIRRGMALERLVPAIEALAEDVERGLTGRLGIIQKAQELARLFRSLLTRGELADETSEAFVETLYMYITGEIYAVVGEGSTPAFDDRRTALPGATFVGGRPVMHAGADARTEILLSNLRGMMSRDEIVEYANVYELRTDRPNARLGFGPTREVVYKTNRRPLENSLVEKRLSRSTPGYSSYVLARIGALRALGIGLSDFYLLLRHRTAHGPRTGDYYIRRRCEGEPMEAIPASYFRSAADATVEDEGVVLALAALMGDAAAQNLAMKKYDPAARDALYGVGKEIYEFGYDLAHEHVAPQRVSTCSIRGSFGWPSLDYTEANFKSFADFYLARYAEALAAYHRRHARVPLATLAARFMDGFEVRTRAMAWHLSVMRDRFAAFDPRVPPRYRFARKWKFVLWSLERQNERLAELRASFLAKLGV